MAAEAAAFEVAFVPLTQARALVELYAEKGDPKFERAALKYLARYLGEAEPSLTDVAQLAALLAERGLIMRGAVVGVACGSQFPRPSSTRRPARR